MKILPALIKSTIHRPKLKQTLMTIFIRRETTATWMADKAPPLLGIQGLTSGVFLWSCY